MAKGLEETLQTEVRFLRTYNKELLRHSTVLGELVDYIEKKDLLDEELYELVDKANNLLAGPTRAYVDQD
jgi:hypothetical protein